MIERERKFLFKGDLEKLLKLSHHDYFIEQFYLWMGRKSEVRVRKSVGITSNWDKPFKKENFVITYKRDTIDPNCRYEIEIPIPLFLGKILFNRSKKIIKKTRYHLYLYKGCNVFIDRFQNPSYLPTIVEIEFEDKEKLMSIPLYCGKEITNDLMYKNKNIYKML